MHYTTKSNEDETRADVNYACPCGCTAGLVYDREAGPTELGECCCGRILSVGDESEAEVRRHLKDGVSYEMELDAVTLPWGVATKAALAVPSETLEAERTSPGGQEHHDHDHHAHEHHDEMPVLDHSLHQHAANQVKDPVCGMMIDPARAAASSEYQGMTYYFCATSCKQKFDADPSQYVKSGGLLGWLKR